MLNINIFVYAVQVFSVKNVLVGNIRLECPAGIFMTFKPLTLNQVFSRAVK